MQRADGSQKFISFQTLYSLQSTGQGTYTYLDKSPSNTNRGYRLLQNDAFERVTYSDIVTIGPEAPASKELIRLYPNPVVTELQVTLNTGFTGNSVHMMLMNTSGQVLLNKDLNASNITQNVSSLMAGTYLIELTDPATKQVIGRKKFIKN